MTIRLNERQGTTKVYWSDVRERVTTVEPGFAEIVDTLAPDEAFPLYLAYYPYGETIADTIGPFLPHVDGNMLRLNDGEVCSNTMKHLGYGRDSLPMGMVLEKEIEYFIDLKEDKKTIPWLMYKPGAFFPYTTIFGQQSLYSHTPNGVLITTAGARSVFMLPHIGCASHHINLQREFNINSSAPKSLYEHWYLFKDIVNNKIIDSDWRCCILFFSENWLTHLYENKAWIVLKSYLLQRAWERFEYDRNRVFYEIIFSLIQKKRNLKPNPYIADTARHLFSILLGAAPGYAPANDDNALPVNVLQKIFVNFYGLKKYFPTIMAPKNYNFEKNSQSIYYSFQHPTTQTFSPKSRVVASTLYEMRELEHIMRIFREELTKKGAIGADTVLSHAANRVDFQYFHNEIDKHNIIKLSSDIPMQDKQFDFNNKEYKLPNAQFAEDAKFVRGCIRMTAKPDLIF